MVMAHRFMAFLFLAGLLQGFAPGQDEIVARESSRVDSAIGFFDGEASPGVARGLAGLLEASGYFNLLARAGGIVIAVHDFRAGNTRRLQEGEAPSWAPDSRHLASTSGGSLYRMNVDTGAGRRFAVAVEANSEPSWGR